MFAPICAIKVHTLNYIFELHTELYLVDVALSRKRPTAHMIQTCSTEEPTAHHLLHGCIGIAYQNMRLGWKTGQDQGSEWQLELKHHYLSKVLHAVKIFGALISQPNLQYPHAYDPQLSARGTGLCKSLPQPS